MQRSLASGCDIFGLFIAGLVESYVCACNVAATILHIAHSTPHHPIVPAPSSAPGRLGAATLQFPCHLYYLSAGKLCKYSLVSKRSGPLLDLMPQRAGGGDSSAAEAAAATLTPEPRALVHSPRQQAWLVFCCSDDTDIGRPGAGWVFTLLHDLTVAAKRGARYLPGARHGSSLQWWN